MTTQKTYKKKYKSRTKDIIKKNTIARLPAKRVNIGAKNAKKKRSSKKNTYKKPKAKKLTNKQLQMLRASKPASLQLNLDFYQSAEGVYNSYWLGKFINTLLREGKKKTVMRYVYKAMAQIKFTTAANPLILFLEVLDKIKPIFRLRNYIVRRVIIKEFPIAVLRPRRLILAVHWLKDEVQSNSGKFATSLDNEIASKLVEFKLNPKKNNLVKKRNEFTKRIIKAQFNIRYNFR